MRRLEPSEKQIQTSFFEWLKFKTDVRSYAFAIPNGGYRNKFEAYNLVNRGFPQVSPICLLLFQIIFLIIMVCL